MVNEKIKLEGYLSFLKMLRDRDTLQITNYLKGFLSDYHPEIKVNDVSETELSITIYGINAQLRVDSYGYGNEMSLTIGESVKTYPIRSDLLFLHFLESNFLFLTNIPSVKSVIYNKFGELVIPYTSIGYTAEKTPTLLETLNALYNIQILHEETNLPKYVIPLILLELNEDNDYLPIHNLYNSNVSSLLELLNNCNLCKLINHHKGISILNYDIDSDNYTISANIEIDTIEYLNDLVLYLELELSKSNSRLKLVYSNLYNNKYKTSIKINSPFYNKMINEILNLYVVSNEDITTNDIISIYPTIKSNVETFISEYLSGYNENKKEILSILNTDLSSVRYIFFDHDKRKKVRFIVEWYGDELDVVFCIGDSSSIITFNHDYSFKVSNDYFDNMMEFLKYFKYYQSKYDKDTLLKWLNILYIPEIKDNVLEKNIYATKHLSFQNIKDSPSLVINDFIQIKLIDNTYISIESTLFKALYNINIEDEYSDLIEKISYLVQLI